MEPPRRKLLVILAVGAVLILIGVFSSSWVSGSANGNSVKAALTGATSCSGGQCQSIKLSSLDENLSLVGIGGILIGLVAVGAAGYAAFLLIRRRESALDPKKLALPAAAGAASVVAFLFMSTMRTGTIPLGMSWGGFVALAGYAATAGAMFLTSVWIVPRPAWAQQGYAPPQQAYTPPPQQPQQPQGYAPPQQPGYAQPPPQQGYAPPSQQGYAPPQQPVQVQPIQPILPTMPRGPMMPDPRAPASPQAMYPMAPPGSQPPGSQPPVAMMQKQSTTIAPGSNPCPRCTTGLAYSPTHGKWYCARCQQYL